MQRLLLGVAISPGSSLIKSSACQPGCVRKHIHIQISFAGDLTRSLLSARSPLVQRSSRTHLLHCRPAPPAGPSSVAGSEAEGSGAVKPPPRKRMASRFDAQIDPNLSAEDRRRARRMLSNRESARRSRHRKETFLQVIMLHSSLAHAVRSAWGCYYSSLVGEAIHVCLVVLTSRSRSLPCDQALGAQREHC